MRPRIRWPALAVLAVPWAVALRHADSPVIADYQFMQPRLGALLSAAHNHRGDVYVFGNVPTAYDSPPPMLYWEMAAGPMRGEWQRRMIPWFEQEEPTYVYMDENWLTPGDDTTAVFRYLHRHYTPVESSIDGVRKLVRVSRRAEPG